MMYLVLMIYVISIFGTSVLVTECSEHSSLLTKLRKLTCLCNENLNCINQDAYSSNQPYNHLLGYCSTNSGGRCYTARAINVQPLMHYLSTGSVFMDQRNVNFEAKQEPSRRELNNTFDHINPEDFIQTTYGCITMPQEVTLLCNGNLPRHAVPQAIECCNSTDGCNSHLLPKFVHHKSDREAVIAALLHLKASKMKQDSLRHSRLPKFTPDMLKESPSLNPNYSLPISEIANRLYFSKDQKDDGISYVFYIILVITFSIVLIVLTLVLACVCFVYRRRLNKRRKNLTVSNFSDTGFSKQILPSQIFWSNNEWADTAKNELLDCGVSKNMGKPMFNGASNGSSSQTLSTDLTRNIGSISSNRPRLSPDMTHGNECLRLLPETIGKQVVLNQILGRGRLSDVWKATWRGEPVLAKIFRSNNEFTQNVWRRTVHLHRSMLLRHQSIHGLMAVDWLDYPTAVHLTTLKKCSVELWNTAPSPCALLIGEFNLMGTLEELLTQSYFTSTSLDKYNSLGEERESKRLSWLAVPSTSPEIRLKIMLNLASSLTQGLCFLHSEFSGTRGKPALAHRNLKPSNIYIRPDWSCCIGDIGFAVRSLPCLLPIPLVQLHNIYKQEHAPYFEPISTGQIQMFNQSTVNQIPNLVSSHSLSPWNTNSQLKHSDTLLLTPNNYSKPTMDKCNELGRIQLSQLEQLDWWPIGGWHVGTARYMAPELLDHSLNPFCLESHQKADIYALALILWELVAWALPLSIWPNRFATSETVVSNTSSRSSTDSMSLTNSGSSLAPKPNDLGHRTSYSAAFQEEFLNIESNKIKSIAFEIRTTNKLCDPTRVNAIPAHMPKPSGDQNLNRRQQYDLNLLVENSDLKSLFANMDEPDVLAMRYLVCDLNLRPFVPNAIHRFNQDVKRSTSVWARTTIHVTELKHASSIVLNPLDPNRDPLQTLNAVKNLPLLGRESSSSGASSLNSAHTHPIGNSTDSLQPTKNSRIHQIQNLVANHFATLLPECWIRQPDSRLTALRIKKSLQRITDQLVQDVSQTTQDKSLKSDTISTSEQYKSACTGSSTLEGRSC